MLPPWAELQAEFAGAIVDTRQPPPSVIECGRSGPCGGFAVYRNNAVVSLIDALQDRFPVTCRLVGEEFFRVMAHSYADGHRPKSPLMMYYGDDFPAFMGGFAPAKDVPYLADVARLEVAWSEAYHAPDDHSLKPRALTGASPDALLRTRLALHSSVRMQRSAYPIADIWAAHQKQGAVTPVTDWRGQDVLIVRPDAGVHVHTLGPGVYAFVCELLNRKCVQEAAEAALCDHLEFDTGESLVNLLRIGAVVALEGASGLLLYDAGISFADPCPAGRDFRWSSFGHLQSLGVGVDG
jgi:hypothetical protein